MTILYIVFTLMKKKQPGYGQVEGTKVVYLIFCKKS